MPTWVYPLVTNGIVFGHITDSGYPYPVDVFGAATNAPRIPSGIVLALDKDTGERLWEFNVGAPVGIGGPSVGNGMLLVTTGNQCNLLLNTDQNGNLVYSLSKIYGIMLQVYFEWY